MKRLSLQHHISVLTLKGKLHFSPIKEDGKILDLGTGNGIFLKKRILPYFQTRYTDNWCGVLPGIWAIDVGKESQIIQVLYHSP